MATTFDKFPAQRRVARPVALGSQSLVPVYLAATLVYLLFVPEQLHIRLFGFYLPPYRIFMLPATLYLLFSAVAGRLRFVWVDWLIVLASAWIWLASYVTSGLPATAFAQGGAHTLDIAFAYFLARAAIQTPRDLRHFLILIVPGVAIVSLFVIQEALTHTRILQRVASDITGSPYRLRDDVRLGLMRGTGPFPHPILAGIFLASFLPIFLASGLRGWPRMVGIAASLGGFFSMSSAALLGLLMGGILWCYDWVSEKISNITWRLFLLGSGFLYATVELTSNSGFYGLMIRYASLNTTSAYNRVLIWNYGTENIAQHPWFGLGYADWVRPSWMHSGSFDHFWLIMALRFGIPTSLLLIGATVAGLILLAIRSSSFAPQDARLMRGVAISLAVFALGAVSVSLWLSVLVWFFILLGIAVSLAYNLRRTPNTGRVLNPGVQLPNQARPKQRAPNGRR